MTVTSSFMRTVPVEDGWTTPANSRRDPFTASLFRTAFAPSFPEDEAREEAWDAKNARAEERARYREEMGE